MTMHNRDFNIPDAFIEIAAFIACSEHRKFFIYEIL